MDKGLKGYMDYAQCTDEVVTQWLTWQTTKQKRIQDSNSGIIFSEQTYFQKMFDI